MTVAWRRNSSAKTFSAKRKFAQFTGRRKLCWRVKVKTGFNCDCNVDRRRRSRQRSSDARPIACNICQQHFNYDTNPLHATYSSRKRPKNQRSAHTNRQACAPLCICIQLGITWAPECALERGEREIREKDYDNVDPSQRGRSAPIPLAFFGPMR